MRSHICSGFLHPQNELRFQFVQNASKCPQFSFSGCFRLLFNETNACTQTPSNCSGFGNASTDRDGKRVLANPEQLLGVCVHAFVSSKRDLRESGGLCVRAAGICVRAAHMQCFWSAFLFAPFQNSKRSPETKTASTCSGFAST